MLNSKTHLGHGLQYEYVPQDQNVFLYGSLGDKFYIILDGEVKVLVVDVNK